MKAGFENNILILIYNVKITPHVPDAQHCLLNKVSPVRLRDGVPYKNVSVV